MKRSQGRAFTLIELIVAMAILMIGIYGVAEVIAAARGAAVKGDDRIAATSLGRMKVREIQSAGETLAARLASPASVTPVLYPDKPKPFPENEKLSWQAGIMRAADPRFARIQVNVSTTSGSKQLASVDGIAAIPQGAK